MNIAILSRHPGLYSNQRLAAAAEARGCRTQVVDPSAALPAARFDAVIPRYGPYWQDSGQALLRAFEASGAIALNGSAAMARARDAAGCVTRFAAAGLPMPQTVVAGRPLSEAQLRALAFGFPMVLKRFRGSQGHGVSLLSDIGQARHAMAELPAADAPFLLQEFIEEADGRDLRLLLVGGQVIAAMQRVAKPGEFRANIHQGGSGGPVRATGAEIDMAIRAAAATGLDVAGVDIIRSRRGPLLLEVNACPGFEALERVSGHDIASNMLNFLICKRYGKLNTGNNQIIR